MRNDDVGRATSFVLVGIGAQFTATLALVFGPWTNDAAELDGWDVDRFRQIADRSGRAWVDEPVEYPPGTVALIEVLAVGGVVTTHRLLAIASFVVFVAIATALNRTTGRVGVATFALLCLPLVPGGLVRFDLWAAGLGLAALFALQHDDRNDPANAAKPALAIVVGAAIKLVPVVVLPVAIARRRWRAVGQTVALGAAAIVGWFAYVGGVDQGFDAVEQVISLRGATGWHVESLPGALVALIGGEEARLEANAYRVGSISGVVTTVGRVAFAIVTLVFIVMRRRLPRSSRQAERSRDATMVVGLIAALLVTAPLLSPQFLLWLTPFVAVVAADLGWRHPMVVVTGVAIIITGATLAAFGPPGVDARLAALLLTARNGLLLALIPIAARQLSRS